MENIKPFELYAVLLILCAAVLFFGLFQMQASLNAVMNKQAFSSFQFALKGVQISAIGLLLTTFILFVFFRRLRKKHRVLRKKHRELKEKVESKKKKPSKKK